MKIVSLDDIREKDYTLSVNTYIEKKAQEIVPPSVVRSEYINAVKEAKESEQRLIKLLTEGGYLDEQ